MKFWELLPFTESCFRFKSSVTDKKNLLTHKKGLVLLLLLSQNVGDELYD